MRKSILHFSLVFLLVLLLCFVFSCKKQMSKGLTDEEAKAILDQVLEIWNNGKMDLVKEAYSPNVILSASFYMEKIKGFEAINGWVTSTRTAFPDFRLSFDEMIVKGDTIAVAWRATGTHTGILSSTSGNLPPTGKTINISGIAIDKIESEKLTQVLEIWTNGSLK